MPEFEGGLLDEVVLLLWLDETEAPVSVESAPLDALDDPTPPPSDDALVPLLPDEGALFDVTGPCVGLAPMVGLPPNRSLNGSLAAL